MNRFFIDETPRVGAIVAIRDEQDIHHSLRVLRLKVGDDVEICDGRGTEAVGRIVEATKQSIELEVMETTEIQRESPLEITLFQALPKGQKMDMLLQKGTEAGITGFVPVQSERCVVRLSSEADSKKKVERWQEIVDEAAKQSKRGKIPSVAMPIKLQDAQKLCKEYDAVLIAHTGDGVEALRATLQGYEAPKRVAVWIGPEGGFTEDEAVYLASCGGKVITLGPRILRTETAGLVITSILQYCWGDFGGLA